MLRLVSTDCCFVGCIPKCCLKVTCLYTIKKQNISEYVNIINSNYCYSSSILFFHTIKSFQRLRLIFQRSLPISAAEIPIPEIEMSDLNVTSLRKDGDWPQRFSYSQSDWKTQYIVHNYHNSARYWLLLLLIRVVLCFFYFCPSDLHLKSLPMAFRSGCTEPRSWNPSKFTSWAQRWMTMATIFGMDWNHKSNIHHWGVHHD
jgi:hypothetical protein